MSKYYLDNKRFEELIKLYCIDTTDTKLEEELIDLFDKLISNILVTFKFHIDYDDAKQECYLLIFKILKNFNKEQGSAFNYFTTVIVNNLKLIYTKDKKYKQKLSKYLETLLPHHRSQEFPPHSDY